jgi:hypothetical protein
MLRFEYSYTRVIRHARRGGLGGGRPPAPRTISMVRKGQAIYDFKDPNDRDCCHDSSGLGIGPLPGIIAPLAGEI